MPIGRDEPYPTVPVALSASSIRKQENTSTPRWFFMLARLMDHHTHMVSDLDVAVSMRSKAQSSLDKN